jgi:hypothetical protein
MASRKEVKWKLIKALCGTNQEWFNAVVYAKSQGWSLEECQSIVTWYHPSTFVYAGLGMIAFVSVCMGFFR